jgi:hypothetical protein
VTLSHCVDAKLTHDKATGRSIRGILPLSTRHPLNGIPRCRPFVETDTYGSEFVAVRICVEKIIDLCNTLRFLGVPIREK